MKKVDRRILIRSPLLTKQQDSLIWWKQHANEYPNIQKLAVKYLSLHLSSVNYERLFNVAGNIYSENRNRLSVDNAEKLLFIMKNMKIVDFMY